MSYSSCHAPEHDWELQVNECGCGDDNCCVECSNCGITDCFCEEE